MEKPKISTIPNSIYWPGRGEATLISSQTSNNLTYRTICERTLYVIFSHGMTTFKAQYKGHTTFGMSSPELAMESLNSWEKQQQRIKDKI